MDVMELLQLAKLYGKPVQYFFPTGTDYGGENNSGPEFVAKELLKRSECST